MAIELEVGFFELNAILAALSEHSHILESMTKEYIRTGQYLLSIRDNLIRQAQRQGFLSDSFFVYQNNSYNRSWISECKLKGATKTDKLHGP